MAKVRMLKCGQISIPAQNSSSEDMCLEQRITVAINEDLLKNNISVDEFVTFKYKEGVITYWYKGEETLIRKRTKSK